MLKLLKILGAVQIIIGVVWFIASQIVLYHGHFVGFLIAACGLAQFVLGGSLIYNAEDYVDPQKQEETENFTEIDPKI